ncbi:T9SS type A sorting domain-containing protein [Flavobacterium sp. CAU 1735]|uniref:T9SS-dependent choice-of-anchor J family protein n=1 Tax=Flavobacterium sp. CAU 1735 TaxID=3140361 RepID=UPI00326016A9
MKLFLFILLASGTINAQRTLFEDSFETYSDFSIDHVGNWTMLDLDGGIPKVTAGIWENKTNPQAFIIFNHSTLGAANLYDMLSMYNYRARTGDKCAISWKNQAVNNDWMISPPVLLGASSNQLRFWINSFATEDYEVGVYRGVGNPTATSDFEIIEGNSPGAGKVGWRERIFNLDTYAGETIRIGIHYRSSSIIAHCLMVDDFLVTTATLSTTDFFAKNFSVFPNPAQDVLNITAKNGMEIKGIQVTDLNGRIVKSVAVQRQAEAQINVSDLTVGAYFISVQTNEGIATSKFLKN